LWTTNLAVVGVVDMFFGYEVCCSGVKVLGKDW